MVSMVAAFISIAPVAWTILRHGEEIEKKTP